MTDLAVASVDRLEPYRDGAQLESEGPPDPATEPPDDLFRAWTPGELLDAERTFRWRVRGMLVHPTYGMLAGERKTLKSYLATFVNLAVAAGVPVFDHFTVDQAVPVVTYVGEGGRVPYTRRIERVAAAMGVDLRHLPLRLSFDIAPITSEIFRETLQRDLREMEPGLVTLDPLYAFHGPATNAANLFEEGALLSGLSAPCVDAGASLLVLSHFNKTGTGRGLDRITQAGGQEWSDSWVLLSHREAPDVAAGRFRLLLEIGSRQWGGTEWDLDLNVGRFDVDLGEFDGDITWELRRHEGGGDGSERKEAILRRLTAAPWALTKEQACQGISGSGTEVRSCFDLLDEGGQIASALVAGTEGTRQVKRWRWATANEPRPDAG